MAFASTSTAITRGWRQPGRRRPRYSSSHWLWTAASCLLSGTTATTGTSSNASSSPLASAFAPRRSTIVPSNRHHRGLSGSGRGGGGGPNSSRSDADADASFTIHPSLLELLDEFDYDALILDQFGVLHNGKYPLAGTVDCVERIATGEKKLRLIVLSNTSSPSRTTLDRLHNNLGFDRSHFCGAVTSGEEAGRHIREVYGSDPDNGKRKKFVWCTWDATNENVPDPAAFLELCGPHVEPTVDVAAADFVVAHGSGAIRGYRNGVAGEGGEMEIVSMGSFLDDGNLGEGTPIHSLLEECAGRRLPLICANPDLVVQYHDGGLKHMPGKIAQTYKKILEERLGGDSGENVPSVTIYGKPHAEHFEACLRKLEEEEDRGGDAATTSRRRPLRVAHVGDSLHHDVAGANAAGVPSIFIVGGIHAEELLSPEDDGSNMPSRETLQDLFDKEGITPTHVLPVFNY